MRVLVGSCFILAGLAAGTHGVVSRVATNPGSPPEIATERLPAQALPHSPAVSAIVTLPAKAPAATFSVPPAAVSASSKHPAEGVSLVRELQQELRRVECYDGSVNGIWTAPTREAMKTFLARANAKLPTDKPDHILLALLQGHAGRACGSCPAGQEPFDDGRCLPNANAVMARASTKVEPLLEHAPRPAASQEKPTTMVPEPPRSAARRVHRQPPIEGRMSAGAGIVAPPQPAERDAKLAAAPPFPASPPEALSPRERRAARHVNRGGRSAFRSRAYLRPMRPIRYAFRPFRRSRSIAALFGFF